MEVLVIAIFGGFGIDQRSLADRAGELMRKFAVLRLATDPILLNDDGG